VAPHNSVTVIGAGAWGTAVAHLLSHNCEIVHLWASRPSVADDIRATGRNRAYLPEVRLRPNVIASCDVTHDLLTSRLFVWAIPVQSLRCRVRFFAPHLPPDAIAVNLGKGLEEGTWARPSDILAQECLSLRAFGSLFGPNIASEVGAGLYTEATLALSSGPELEGVASCFTSPSFLVHTTTDYIGIEIGAALKNVCSIAAGLCDGLGLGGNTKSLVIAACLQEIREVGELIGAAPETMASRHILADLLTSCYSPSGRNRRVGEYLGQGLSLERALAALGGRVAEGIATCSACYSLCSQLGRTFPVVESLHELLHRRLDAGGCVNRILSGRAQSREDALDVSLVGPDFSARAGHVVPL
jgi:glycerol-3-phosphate dehydrogenase (NAD(P)+)